MFIIYSSFRETKVPAEEFAHFYESQGIKKYGESFAILRTPKSLLFTFWYKVVNTAKAGGCRGEFLC